MTASEVDEVVHELKSSPGFASYMILNNDGIVIKYENMDYKKAVHIAHLLLDLCGKSRRYIRELFEPPDNEVESLRLKTKEYELIVAQYGNFILVVLQQTLNEEKKQEEAENQGEGAGSTTEGQGGKKE